MFVPDVVVDESLPVPNAQDPLRGARRGITYNQMVVQTESSDAEVDRIFRALADATRRDIMRRVLTEEAAVSDLADSYDMSFAAVQKHVAVLEEAGLVTKHPRGRQRIVRGAPERIRRAQRLLAQFEDIWRARVDRLDALLDERKGT